ncbi:serine carboxypeptidase-like 7 [Senna tora]|uniref:Serine carboxypeptidase-like 7 n=1 Tax=Senna tora TaxID=362788 RepID=A0A834W7R0_9FABA|nr:serine carboxypeptidase-like 7 [Senna tora]
MKSERNPKEDPLMLWLTGGPGCSAFSGLVFEIGPFMFEIKEYNGSVPALALNPHSWTKISSIIFVDLPANTGFSYAKPPIANQRSDSKQIQHALQFIRKWLMDHPEFFSNSFYVGGDSYSGMIVPAIALEILKGNEDSVKPSINYHGYLLGNPITKPEDGNYKIPFAHGMGLISDELYESLKSNCGEKYQNVDPNNEMCVRDMAAYEKGYAALLSTYWANDDMVRRALGETTIIRETPEL